MSDDIDEYAPTQALLEVPDLSGYDLPDMGLDDGDPPIVAKPAAGRLAPPGPPPRRANGPGIPPPRATHPGMGQPARMLAPVAPPPSSRAPALESGDTTRGFNPDEAAALFGLACIIRTK
jgi:hypothetical protein